MVRVPSLLPISEVYRKWVFRIIGFVALPASAYLWYTAYKSSRKHPDNECLKWVDDQPYATSSEVIDITDDANKLDALSQQLSDASAEGHKIVRMKIPSRAIGAIIGKQGCVIKRIQSSTKTVVHFVDRLNTCIEPQMGDSLVLPANSNQSSTSEGQPINGQTDNPSTSDRDFEELSIKGLSHRVLSAAQEIQRIIDSVPVLCEVKLSVDNKYIGFIIGKKGMSIRRIKEESGARVDVGQSNNSSTIRIIAIRGTVEQVECAKQCIDDLIKDVDRRESSYSMGSRLSRPLTNGSASSGQLRGNDSQNGLSSIQLNRNESDKQMSTNAISSYQSPTKALRNADYTPAVVNKSSAQEDKFSSNHVKSTEKQQPSQVSSPLQSFPSIPLPPHETFPQVISSVDVVVSCVVNCEHFCIQLCSPSIGKDGLQQLVFELTQYYHNEQQQQDIQPSREIREGDFVAVLFSAENTWQRAIVHSVTHADNGGILVDVDYCDYGDCEQLPYENIRLLSDISEPLRSKIWSVPIQAISARLKDIRSKGSSGEWSEEAIVYFESIAGVSKRYTLKAFWGGMSPTGEVVVLLNDDTAIYPRKQDLASELVRMGFAEWTK